jgi:hypothetical protein
MMPRAPLLMMLLIGCATGERFADRAILWRDPDDKPIPVPQKREPGYHWLAVRDAAFQPLDHITALDYGREATNVNALDEVPDSSWWTDRRRLPQRAQPRSFSDDEIARGAFADHPRPILPFTIIKGKDKGGTLGFIVKDAIGRQFAVKIDPPGYVDIGTSTEVVVSRLAWAAGWNVPAESIVELRVGDLILSPSATTTDADGNKIALDAERFRQLLAKAPMSTAGTIRALASLWIEGIIVGPYRYFGRRADDGNDRVAHQDRRDLRGYGVFSAWVNNIDSTEVNTLDSYVGERGRGHVVHFQQDVGGAFGSRPRGTMDYWMGSDTYFSPGRMVESIVSFGLIRRAWEGEALRARRARMIAVYPEIGWFDGDAFEPQKWHPVFDNPAFERATARDRYWGAKRVVQIGESELRAAIAEGHYGQAAALQLFETLWKRRQAIARAYFTDVAPLDYFRVERGELCWDDLWIDAGLGDEQSAAYDADGQVRVSRCAPVGRGYRVVSLRVRRAGERRFGPAVRVHLIDRRIVGVER